MLKEKLKLFVGEYYDDRIFEGEYFEGNTPFNNKIHTYTLEEVLKLAFVENVVDEYNERAEWQELPNWDELTFEEKAKEIEEYTASDDIAGVLCFDTEDKAAKYKQNVLNELKELEKEIEYSHAEQDREGCYRKVYVKALESREAKLIVNKAGSGSTTFRSTLPQTWIRQMGLSEENRNLVLSFDGKKITIENKDDIDE